MNLPDGCYLVYDQDASLLPPYLGPAVTTEVEKIAKIWRIPYWLLGDEPRPSWFRRPIWRLRARRWSRA